MLGLILYEDILKLKFDSLVEQKESCFLNYFLSILPKIVQ